MCVYYLIMLGILGFRVVQAFRGDDHAGAILGAAAAALLAGFGHWRGIFSLQQPRRDGP